MKFECSAWVSIEAVMGVDGDIKGAKITQMWRKPHPKAVKLVLSVPESFFRTPEIHVVLGERNPEIWEGSEMSDHNA